MNRQGQPVGNGCQLVTIVIFSFVIGALTKWIIGLIFGAVLLALSGVKLSRTPRAEQAEKAKAPPDPTAPSSTFTWDGGDHFDFQVVGSSNYQPALRAIVGDHGNHESKEVFEARLVPEDDNAFDNKAICIRIRGKIVGYLSREDARSFRRRLSSKKLSGQETTCKAMIVGGWTRRTGERVSYGVRLDMKPFW